MFHPKVYLFSDDDSSWEVIIGSANFTRAAFTRNVECAGLFGSSDQAGGLTYAEILQQIKVLWARCKNKSVPKTCLPIAPDGRSIALVLEPPADMRLMKFAQRACMTVHS